MDMNTSRSTFRVTGSDRYCHETVTGTVEYINAEHRYVRVVYVTAKGETRHECFKY